MKTEIKLTVTTADGRSLAPFFRVKLDKNKAPYIVVDNNKYFITKMNFPREFSVDYGLTTLYVDMKEGQSELQTLVDNANKQNL